MVKKQKSKKEISLLDRWKTEKDDPIKIVKKNDIVYEQITE